MAYSFDQSSLQPDSLRPLFPISKSQLKPALNLIETFQIAMLIDASNYSILSSHSSENTKVLTGFPAADFEVDGDKFIRSERTHNLFDSCPR